MIRDHFPRARVRPDVIRPPLTLRALGARVAGPGRAARNRVSARGAWMGAQPELSGGLPQPPIWGDADRGLALVSGRWLARGAEVAVSPGTIWEARLPHPWLEAERQACLWLDDLAALGSRGARVLAQTWVREWIRRFGRGAGPGWMPEVAGRRVKRWVGHAAMLTQGLEPAELERFWRALAAQQRYLLRAWPRAAPGLPRARALAGLVWSGRVLPHPGHGAAVAALGALAEALIDRDGGTPSRVPEHLAELLVLLIWTARLLEDAGEQAEMKHLTAIARAVPVLRQLRLGDGTLARFHGGGVGAPERIDQALAELRHGHYARPRLAMGYARLAGGRVALVMDGAAPPGGGWATGAHAGTLAFEMSIGRQPVVVNLGPGTGRKRHLRQLARQTAAHSTVEIGGQSSARVETRGLAARTFGARLAGGPTFVSVRQAQDATGMWLLATHDGYVASHGLLHERRIFVGARGREVRGEEIISVTDARARAQFDRKARAGGAIAVAARFHLHPSVEAEYDVARQEVLLSLASGEVWGFRAAGGRLELEASLYLDPDAAGPMPAQQMVVHAEAVEYLGQITWSFTRIAEAPAVRERASG